MVFTTGMPGSLRTAFADLCRSVRTDLDISQGELGQACSLSRPVISAIETGRRAASLDDVERIATALGMSIDLVPRRPGVIAPRLHDVVHARCVAYVQRRLTAAGFTVLREVEVVHGRWHGWIDLLAFDPRSGLLLIIEVKSSLVDLGSVERQLAWYEREAGAIARARGWRATGARSWLLLLDSLEVDAAISHGREVLGLAFPRRAAAMRRELEGPVTEISAGRALAVIDPSSRRRDWLRATRVDGRRASPPYRDRADAEARWARRHRSAG